MDTVKALIFDFDGLILDTEWPAYQSWCETYREHGCEFSLDMWSRVLGGSGSEWDHIGYLSQATRTRLDGDAIKKKRQARKLALIEQESVLPGVVEYLEAARELGLKLALVSSSGRSWVERYLPKLLLTGRFDLVVCAEDVERVKPHPDLFLLALEHLDVEADEAIVFEDSPNGVRAAKAAGICCVAVPNRASALLPMPPADRVMTSLAEESLVELIRALPSNAPRRQGTGSRSNGRPSNQEGGSV